MSASVSDLWGLAAPGLGLGLAVFLVGLATKALDDLLDDPRSLATADRPAAWVAPYIVLALAAAAGLAPAATVSLVLSAYAVGMLTSPLQGLPSGFPSWAESLAAVALGAVLLGPAEVLGSMLLLGSAQVLDDAFDLERDRTADRANVAAALGKAPAYALGAALWAAAALVSPAKALAGLVPILIFAALPATAGWAARPGALGRLWGRGQAGPRSRALLYAGAAAVAALLGWCGAAAAASPPGPAAGGAGAGPWVGWAALACAAAACVAGLAAVVLAYHRGLAQGRRRGREAEAAWRVLDRRVEVLEKPPGGPDRGASRRP